ncbi:uncharacterized protein LOC113351536 [Papaver somniferum]|uniref:uncharacterized protein LOC113351536 n=1 Tax=Papaver somniferum TaxID=3469 RepID=UPI000E6F4ECB|nr:uncharacterized protein LOC113351536 [Papaver somniferum]
MEDVHPNCSFGCNTPETIEHLLITCPYAKYVWALEPNPIAINSDDIFSFLEICKSGIGKVEAEIPIEMILTKAWFIWKERCNRVFEQKQQSNTQLGLEIKRFLEFWYKGNMNSRQSSKGNLRIQNWSFPKSSQLKLNIDVAWISVDLSAGFSLILRNDAGDFELGKAGSFTTSSPEEAEAIWLLQGAIWALDKGISNFTVEGDCQNLFDYLNGKDSQISWQNRSIMDEVKEKISRCQIFLGFFLVPRTANNVADVLVKEAKSFKNFLNRRTIPPACIKSALAVDKSNARDISNSSTLDGSTQSFASVKESSYFYL